MKRLAIILTCMLLAIGMSGCIPDRIPDMSQAGGTAAAPEAAPASWQKETGPVTLTISATNVYLGPTSNAPCGPRMRYPDGLPT